MQFPAKICIFVYLVLCLDLGRGFEAIHCMVDHMNQLHVHQGWVDRWIIEEEDIETMIPVEMEASGR